MMVYNQYGDLMYLKAAHISSVRSSSNASPTFGYVEVISTNGKVHYVTVHMPEDYANENFRNSLTTTGIFNEFIAEMEGELRWANT